MSGGPRLTATHHSPLTYSPLTCPLASCCWDLNPGPPPYQGGALPTELQQRVLSVVRSPLVAVRCITFVRRVRLSTGHGLRSTDKQAGEGNRTLVTCLEGRSSTIELHPRLWSARSTSGRSHVAKANYLNSSNCPANRFLFFFCSSIQNRKSKNPKIGQVGSGGFEPPKAEANRFTVCPR